MRPVWITNADDHSPLSTPLWWPHTRRGPTGSGHDSANEPRGGCCWSKSPWTRSCLWRGDARGKLIGKGCKWMEKESRKKQWRKERSSDVQSILRGGVMVPGPERVGRHHLQSVSWTIQIHHKQTDWWDRWASLWAQTTTRSYKYFLSLLLQTRL